MERAITSMTLPTSSVAQPDSVIPLPCGHFLGPRSERSVAAVALRKFTCLVQHNVISAAEGAASLLQNFADGVHLITTSST